MNVKLQPVDNRSLGEQTYCRIKMALIDGEYRPGERLRLRDLAKDLGTSVTPVREAVLRLVSDGVLRLRSQRDIRVRTLSAGEFLELAAIRKPLEGLAIERFMGVTGFDHISGLERLEGELQEALARRDYRAAQSADRRFMLVIFRTPGNHIFIETLDRVWLVARPTVSLLYSDEGTTRISLGNQALLAALQKRNVHDARRAREKLIDEQAAAIVEMLEDDAGKDAAASG
jgi:DNA-binding GntR family transcriptional regulator